MFVFITVLLAFGVNIGAVSGSQKCQIDTCTFQTPNGIIDLSSLDKPLKFGLYMFNPCKAFTCKHSNDALFCINSKPNATNPVVIPKGVKATCSYQNGFDSLEYQDNGWKLTVTLKCGEKAEITGTNSGTKYAVILSSPVLCHEEDGSIIKTLDAQAPKTATTKKPKTTKKQKTTIKPKTTKKTTTKQTKTTKKPTIIKNVKSSTTVPKRSTTMGVSSVSPAVSIFTLTGVILVINRIVRA